MGEAVSVARVSRRALLGAGVAAALAGCTQIDVRPSGSPSIPAAPRTISLDEQFTALEHSHGARLGVWALDTGADQIVAYNADTRFAFCSTVKLFLAAALLDRLTLAELDENVRYTQADVVAASPITATPENIHTGMTLRHLCDAAVRMSDNTAANLIVRRLGGPPVVQSYLRRLGDTVTHSDRIEPELNTAVPGDLRDTTTPRAWGTDLQKVILGSALPAAKREILTDWAIGNTTGAGLIRAGVPSGWTVGDKTGGGDYGTRNDIAVIWPPERKPLVLVILTSRPDPSDSFRLNDPLIAEAAAAVTTTFR